MDFDWNVLLPEYETDDPDPFDWTDLDQDGFNSQSVSDIIARHKRVPVLAFLDSLGAIYPGGYALAMYAAPHDDGVADASKFNDVDIVHRNLTRTSELIEAVKDRFTILKEYQTDRAHSIWVDNDGEELMLQFVTSWRSTIDTVLSRFDFNNCKICLDPERGFYKYADLDELLEDHTLELGPNWDDYAPPNSLSLSIPRALKYCHRWGWELDPYSLRRLTQLWFTISEDNRWKPPDEVDSGHGVISQGGHVNTEALGTILYRLYDLHEIAPPPEVTIARPSQESPDLNIL